MINIGGGTSLWPGLSVGRSVGWSVSWLVCRSVSQGGKQARKKFRRRSQPEFPGAFKMVEFLEHFMSRFPLGSGVMVIWEAARSRLQNFFQAWFAIL